LRAAPILKSIGVAGVDLTVRFLSSHTGGRWRRKRRRPSTDAPAADATVASVHRAMNEQRRSLESPAAGASMTCECECDRVECFDSFRILLETYDDVRAHALRFVVAPGHESSDELVVATTETYLVVEKVGEDPEAQPTS
jgi:hypothetical protein